jgi:hypothetical protein
VSDFTVACVPTGANTVLRDRREGVKTLRPGMFSRPSIWNAKFEVAITIEL